MLVKLRDISREGVPFERTVMPHEIGLSEDFVDQEKPVVISGRLQLVDGFVLANLEVSYTLDTVCARCLEMLSRGFSKMCEFEIEYKQGDDSVDLGAYIREEVFIGYEPRVLCKEECKGICPSCGAYLNEEKCKCSKENNKE
jgi:uncharacterized protein